MTDNEIVKALECCSSDDDESCQDKACPLFEYCKKDLKALEKAAFDLINRIKGESNKYRNQSQTQKGELTRLYKQVTEQKAEIERLKGDRYLYDDRTGKPELLPRTDIDQIKSEAIKEFAERLKTKVNLDLCETINCSDYLYDLPKLIDNLVKEMTEGDAHGGE